MSLWWLQPGWTDTRCSCGTNIWKSGGDPDWGECYECFNQSHDPGPQPEPPHPPCDICGKHEACAGVGKFGVCSEECANEASRRSP